MLLSLENEVFQKRTSGCYSLYRAEPNDMKLCSKLSYCTMKAFCENRSSNKPRIPCNFIGMLIILFDLGCGFWTHNKKVFDHQYTPELDLNNEDVIQRSPAEEGFVRFWTFIIIFQVNVCTLSLLHFIPLFTVP